MEESEKRTLTKAISWRTTATLTTMIIVYAFTGKLSLSVGVGFVEVACKILLYYLHERVWGRVGWGKAALSRIRLEKEMEEKDLEKIRDLLKELGYL